jgi:bacterioferritin (cytochrome b1)
LEDFLPDGEEHIEFFEYKQKVLDLEAKKRVLKLAEEAAAKEILQKNLDAERIEREKFDQNAVEAQGRLDDETDA